MKSLVFVLGLIALLVWLLHGIAQPADPVQAVGQSSASSEEFVPYTPTPPNGQQQYLPHTVRAGDTPESIARAHHVTKDDLVRVNPGIDLNALYPGQVINIPASQIIPVTPLTVTPATPEAPSEPTSQLTPPPQPTASPTLPSTPQATPTPTAQATTSSTPGPNVAAMSNSNGSFREMIEALARFFREFENATLDIEKSLSDLGSDAAKTILGLAKLIGILIVLGILPALCVLGKQSGGKKS